MKFVYDALLLIASITLKTFIGLKLYKYAPNKYIAIFSTMDGIKIADAESHNGHCLWDFCKYTAPQKIWQYRKATAQNDNILMKPKEGEEYTDKKICSKYNQPINEQAFYWCALFYCFVL